jgi:hypothetical protein
MEKNKKTLRINTDAVDDLEYYVKDTDTISMTGKQLREFKDKIIEEQKKVDFVEELIKVGIVISSMSFWVMVLSFFAWVLTSDYGWLEFTQVSMGAFSLTLVLIGVYSLWDVLAWNNR